MPFIPYYIQHLGETDPAHLNFWISTYTIAGYASLAVFSPIWGWAADRYGRKVMLLRAHFCNAVIISLMGLDISVLTLVLLRCLMGVFSGSSNAAQTLIATCAPNERRGFAMGLLSSSIFAGTMFGGFLGGIIVDRVGFSSAFFLCGVIFLCSGLLVLIGVHEDFCPTASPAPDQLTPRRRFRMDFEPLRLCWLILLLIAAMGLARRIDQPFLPLLVQDIHGSVDGAATWTGIISGITAVAGLLAGPSLGWLADRISVPKVAMISALCAGLLMIPHGLAGTMTTVIIVRFSMIYFAGGLDPVFQIWLAKTTPDHLRGRIFGWAMTAKCLGWVIAAAAGGTIATLFGLRWIYGIGALLFLILIPLIWWASRRLTVQTPLGDNPS